MSLEQKIIGAGVLFLLITASGLWLSRLGKPYNNGILTIHKLIALATVVFAGFIVANLLKQAEGKRIIILMIILAVICIIALFATGALLSIGKLSFTLVRAVHAVVSILLLIVSSATFYLLLRQVKS